MHLVMICFALQRTEPNEKQNQRVPYHGDQKMEGK